MAKYVTLSILEAPCARSPNGMSMPYESSPVILCEVKPDGSKAATAASAKFLAGSMMAWTCAQRGGTRDTVSLRSSKLGGHD